MRALLVRFVILSVLLGIYGTLQPTEVDGQGYCLTCRGGYGGWADCRPTSNDGWFYCQEATQDPGDPSRSFCILGGYCSGNW